MKSFQLFVILVSLTCAWSKSSDFSVSSSSWNSLLRADNLVPSNYDTPTFSSSPLVKTLVKSTILAELETLLNNDEASSAIYENYKMQFNKAERDLKNLFTKSLIKIARHNLDYDSGKSTWFMGVNQFADMTAEEINAFMGGFTTSNMTVENLGQEPPLPTSFARKSATANLGAPEEFDWKNYQGVVGPIRNQKTCGSCTIFGGTSMLESAMALYKSTGNLDLSEQQTLDCNRNGGGCRGNTWPSVLDYLKNGVTTESNYPYQDQQQSCRNPGNIVAKVSNYYRAPNDEESWKDWLSKWGPLGVVVSVTEGSGDWQYYKGGIFNGRCGNSPNHAVVAVGYGVYNGQSYWIIRNSWDTTWGDAGYMYLVRGVDKCRIRSGEGTAYLAQA